MVSNGWHVPHLPIWAIFLITLFLVLVVIEFGYRRGRTEARRSAVSGEQEKEAPVGAMVGAALGLLALLLAFTFGMAADAFHGRKVALLDETNAIRTAYLRASLTPEPHASEVRALLRTYVEAELQWTGLQVGAAVRPAQQLLDEMWVHAAAVASNDSSDVTALFIESIDAIGSAHAERVLVRERSRIPSLFWVVLYAMTGLTLSAMGYHSGVAGTKRSPVTVSVAVTFTLVIVLIADLDRPGEGWVNVSQEPMLELRSAMNPGGGGN